MKTYRILVLLGLVLYVASFFLTAVKDTKTSAGMPGYKCATTALLAPWGGDGLNMLRETPVDYFALLFSGGINPVFLITALALLIRPKGRFASSASPGKHALTAGCWMPTADRRTIPIRCMPIRPAPFAPWEAIRPTRDLDWR